ncbi:hypothetical protein IPJ70_04330 [Candidatus Campbellbacteria bacterium]|nr:MAG: hypothetical protein IPJ70_04330 [Candidatus Campbellbacteria bacterium]
MKKNETFRKFLYNQVALLAGIVGVLFGIFNMLQAPKTDIKVIETLNTIRDNHIHTIEENLKRMEDSSSKDSQEFRDRLTKIETLLNERLPANKN